jgi:predicted RNA-binding protein YlqC (UPF0109 family)
MNLETERLIIRKLRAAHLADFVEYRSDPQVCEFQGFLPMTPEKGKEYIEKLKDAEFGTAGQWVQLCVELKATGKVIGDIGLKPEAYDARIVEWGMSFSPKYQRRGRPRVDFRRDQSSVRRKKRPPDDRDYGCPQREQHQNAREIKLPARGRIQGKFLGRSGKCLARRIFVRDARKRLAIKVFIIKFALTLWIGKIAN